MILRPGDRVLSLHFVEPTKGWRIPGGKVSIGETPARAASRELREETGLVVHEDELELIGTHLIKVDGQDWFGFIFVARYWGGIPIIMEPHKHDDLKFLSLNSLKELNPILAEDVEMLERYLEKKGNQSSTRPASLEDRGER